MIVIVAVVVVVVIVVVVVAAAVAVVVVVGTVSATTAAAAVVVAIVVAVMIMIAMKVKMTKMTIATMMTTTTTTTTTSTAVTKPPCCPPQVFAIILSAMSRDFFVNVYMLLADTLDMIALVNNAINFVLYCTMSQQFREHLMVVKACTGASGQGFQAARFGRKAYQSVEQSCVQTHTVATNGLCVTTTLTTEKSVSHV